MRTPTTWPPRSTRRSTPRHAGVNAPPGFQDAVAWLMAMPDGTQSHWHQTFAAATAERLGATVLSSADTRWTKVTELRDAQGAELAIIHPAGLSAA